VSGSFGASTRKTVSIARAMETVFRVLAPNDPLTTAVEATLASAQQDFPVVEAGRLVGLLTRHDLLDGLARRGAQSAVGDSMQRTLATAEEDERLEAAFRKLEGGTVRSLPVLRDGRVVGLVTLDNVGDLLAIRAALARKPGSEAGSGTGTGSTQRTG